MAAVQGEHSIGYQLQRLRYHLKWTYDCYELSASLKSSHSSSSLAAASCWFIASFSIAYASAFWWHFARPNAANTPTASVPLCFQLTNSKCCHHWFTATREAIGISGSFTFKWHWTLKELVGPENSFVSYYWHQMLYYYWHADLNANYLFTTSKLSPF